MKRALDCTLAIAALLLLAPLMLAIAALVRWRLGQPVLFRQLRPGLQERSFELIKFRSMLPPAPGLSEQQRLTGFGRWLRSTSLDELPELWNVVKGDMALVGPRPLLVEYLPLYNEQQRRRHSVRPGLTGWAQVNGRNALSWEDKFALDIWYVEHQSLSLDLKIILLTVLAVFKRQGIASGADGVTPAFTGAASAESHNTTST